MERDEVEWAAAYKEMLRRAADDANYLAVDSVPFRVTDYQESIGRDYFDRLLWHAEIFDAGLPHTDEVVPTDDELLSSTLAWLAGGLAVMSASAGRQIRRIEVGVDDNIQQIVMEPEPYRLCCQEYFDSPVRLSTPVSNGSNAIRELIPNLLAITYSPAELIGMVDDDLREQGLRGVTIETIDMVNPVGTLTICRTDDTFESVVIAADTSTSSRSNRFCRQSVRFK